MNPKVQYQRHELPWGIEITQFVYLIISLVITSGICVGLIISKEIDQRILWMSLAAIIFWVLFYGTYKIKSWVVAPILIVSVYYIFWGFLEIVNSKPNNYIELGKKAFSILWTTFFLFQLYIFSRPKTKAFFKDRGKTIFS